MSFIAWSLSRLQTYEKCPAQFNHAYILKDCKGTMNDAAQFGIDAHTAIENRLKYRMPLPEKFAAYEPIMGKIEARQLPITVEKAYAFDNEWRIVEYFDKSVWLRVKNDATLVNGDKALTIDWKTGKQWGSDNRQLMMQAVCTFLDNLDVETVVGAYWYLKTGACPTQTYTRNQLGSYLSMLQKMQEPLQLAYNSDTWEYTPSKFACGFCPANPKNGGPCTRATN